MPACITISGLSWSTPDGRSLFSHLDLAIGTERIGLVGRNGVGKSTLLKLISGELAPASGRVSVGCRLGVLHQNIRSAPNETVADLFGVAEALTILRKAEAGDATSDELMLADWTLEARIMDAMQRAGVQAANDTLLAALSGGQRTRIALAALVFADPDFLLLDEPTNNLDRKGRGAVRDLLAQWRTGAIVVSHDRELLGTMDAIVELTSLGATRYGGNWRHYQERKGLELAAAWHDLADAEKRVADVARKAQATAERQARRDGAGRKTGAKGGIPRIALGGLKDRSEATGGDHARLAERRRTQALEAAATARARIEVLQPLSVTIPSAGLALGKTVLEIDAVTAGYIPDRPVLRDLSLAMTGPERLAVTGPNGSGKTTLLALVTGKLQPSHGTVRVMTECAILDQQVSLLDPAASIRDNFRRINPQTDENACRAALARFMFRAEAALQMVSTLSGGQLLRAGLACVLSGSTPPGLLILDEPTNHLDIASIEAVEAGLCSYDGALLVVSHDETFLKNIGVSRRLELLPLP